MVSRLATGLLLAALVAPNSARANYPWQREPGPIAGRWQASGAGGRGFVVQFSVDRAGKSAIGRVAAVGSGDAARRGYLQNEEIFRLTADDYGDWVGHLKWRSVAGAERWEPIRFVATPDRLNATMTLDDCYRNMARSP